MSGYSYFAFGLNIRSDIEFNQPARELGTPDVYVRLRPVPDSLGEISRRGVFYNVSPRRVLLEIHDVARYLAADGNEIAVDPRPGVDPAAVRLFLLGPAFGALLHQRGILPLHGSAISASRGAVIFLGLSGIGKSALAGAFHQRGYPVITDELCAIHAASSPVLMPGNPHLLLWADTLGQLGLDRCDLAPARPLLEKYVFNVGGAFCDQATPIQGIYILQPVNTELSAPVTVSGLRKIEALVSNIYRPHFAAGLNVQSDQIRSVLELARQTPVWLVNRPLGSLHVRDLADSLERHFAR